MKSSADPECICKGNWRAIVSENEHLIDRMFTQDSTREKFHFFGIVHGSDDYYYGMSSPDHKLWLLSCVGSIEGHGFTLVESDPDFRRADQHCVCKQCGEEYWKHPYDTRYPIAESMWVHADRPEYILHRLCDGSLVKL